MTTGPSRLAVASSGARRASRSSGRAPRRRRSGPAARRSGRRARPRSSGRTAPAGRRGSGCPCRRGRRGRSTGPRGCPSGRERSGARRGSRADLRGSAAPGCLRSLAAPLTTPFGLRPFVQLAQSSAESAVELHSESGPSFGGVIAAPKGLDHGRIHSPNGLVLCRVLRRRSLRSPRTCIGRPPDRVEQVGGAITRSAVATAGRLLIKCAIPPRRTQAPHFVNIATSAASARCHRRQADGERAVSRA